MRNRVARLIGTAMAPLALGVAACVPVTTTPTTTTTTMAHIMVVMMENKNYSEVIGNPAQPYVNSLAADYGSATN